MTIYCVAFNFFKIRLVEPYIYKKISFYLFMSENNIYIEFDVKSDSWICATPCDTLGGNDNIFYYTTQNYAPLKLFENRHMKISK